MVDLFCGWPNPALLPVSALAHASSAVLSSPSILSPALLYGPDDGYRPLKEDIARWLSSFYRPSLPITPDRICITGGASQNLACILQVFSDPVYTRHVWMVEPTYHLACRIMDDSGFSGRLRGVPEDKEGIDVAFLERELQAAENKAAAVGNNHPKLKPPRPWRKIYKHVIYAIPTFSNPASQTMSLRRRERLVQLARQYDALIISDDVYDWIQWWSDPASTLAPPTVAHLPRLVDVDRCLDGGPQDEWGNTLSNGSFSKVVGPGVRTGWAEATPKLAYGLSQVGSSRSGGAPSQFTSTLVAQLLPSGILEHHIRHVLQPAYAERYHRTMSAVQEHLFPLGVTLPTEAQEITGGYFIWIALPPPLRASEIARLAAQEELTVASGELFQVQGDATPGRSGFENNLRICFAWEHGGKLEEGIRRLARVVQTVQGAESGCLNAAAYQG